MLALSNSLVTKTESLLSSSITKVTLKTDLEKLFYHSWRSTTRLKHGLDKPDKLEKVEKKDVNTRFLLNYGPREATAYTAAEMPRAYTSLVSILAPLKLSSVTSITDFGCGLSSRCVITI
jgi:hypothetical protein